MLSVTTCTVSPKHFHNDAAGHTKIQQDVDKFGTNSAVIFLIWPNAAVCTHENVYRAALHTGNAVGAELSEILCTLCSETAKNWVFQLKLSQRALPSLVCCCCGSIWTLQVLYPEYYHLTLPNRSTSWQVYSAYCSLNCNMVIWQCKNMRWWQLIACQNNTLEELCMI